MNEVPEIESRRPGGRVRANIALGAVLVLALAVRLHVAGAAQNIARDGTVHLSMARQLATEPTTQVLRGFHYHPGYPAVVAAAARTLGASWPDGWVKVGRGVSIAASLVLLALVYAFGRMGFDRPISLVATLLLALSVPLTEVSCDVLSDSLAAACAVAAVVLGLKARERLLAGRGSAAAFAVGAGLAGGAAYLVRPEGLAAAVVAATLLCWPGGATRVRPGRRVAAIAALAAGAAGCVLPYAMTIGGLTLKKSVADFAQAGAAGWPMLAQASLPAELAEAVRRSFDRMRAAVGTPVAVLAVTCWFFWVVRRWWRLSREDVPIATAPTIWSAVLMLAMFVGLLAALEMHHPRYISGRHGLLPALLLAPCAGAGLAMLIRLTGRLLRWTGTRREPIAAYLWLAGVLGGMAWNALPTLHVDKGCFRQAGRTIRQEFGPGHAVLSPDGWAPFFAESPAEQFKVGGYFLQTEDLTGPDRLASLAGPGGRPYEFVVLSKRQVDEAPNPRLLLDLSVDRRFERVSVWRSADEPQEAWTFRIVRGASRFAPAAADRTAPTASAPS